MLNIVNVHNAIHFLTYITELLYLFFNNFFILYKWIIVNFFLLIQFFQLKHVNINVFFLLSLYSGFLEVQTSSLNLGLINTLSYWHPLLLYVTLSLYSNTQFKNTKLFFWPLLTVFFFLILGMWWASQELLWLGWWNWDGVENSLLFLVFFFFTISHKLKLRKYLLISYKLFLLLYLYFFIILNKTNIFKSIHSFTNSLFNNLSWLFYFYVFIYFLILTAQYKYISFYWYTLIIWVFYFLILIVNNSNIFSKLSTFYVINTTYFIAYVLLQRVRFTLFFLVFVSIKLLIISVFMSYLITYRSKIFFFLHKFLFNIFICLIFLIASNQIVWLQISVYKDFVYTNNSLFNNLFVFFTQHDQNNFFYNTDLIKEVFKNVLALTIFCSNEFIITTNALLKQIKVLTVSICYLFIVLVTEVINWKHKPRFNYYLNMYIYKSDLLVNQQKFRRLNLSVSKYHWGTKSIWQNRLFLFILSNQHTIDLRFYKILLRKIKKKFLKFKIKSYVYLTPNNKTSHKSKNSRMGKGKGMNNRFYYRHKFTKPIIVFKNLNSQRLLKLKSFLTKFFNYKYY